MATESGLEQRKEHALAIARETGVYTPSFIYKHPPISPADALELAFDKELYDFKNASRDPRRHRYFATFRGLSFCRRFGVDIEGAYKLDAETYRPKSALELSNLFKKPSDLSEVSGREIQRRQGVLKELLQFEVSLLRKRGMKVPDFPDILAYCAWVPERTGYNRKLKKWDKRENGSYWTERLPNPAEILWDLQEHYAQFFENAAKAFDPLNDWELYLNGKKDLTSSATDGWNLQNLGKEGLDYYSMCKTWGGGGRSVPSRFHYTDTLITHSTSLTSANEIAQERFLNSSRNNFSADRIAGSYGRVALVFPRDLIEKVYNIFAYTEPACGHEQEMRTYEPISTDFCIGIVPVDPKLFPDTYGGSFGTLALGDLTIKRWSKHFERTGELLDEAEFERVQGIAQQAAFQRPTFVYM